MNDKNKILVVDDDALVRKLIKEDLEGHGFEVITSEDGEDGLVKAFGHKPDLILLDLGLPRKDGVSYIRELRKDERSKNIPVIIFTNYDNTRKVAEALEAGALDYITKTVSMDDIVHLIKKRIGAPPKTEDTAQ